MNKTNRRSFIKKSSMAGLGLGLAGNVSAVFKGPELQEGKRIGMIGLDTGHSVAFTKALNDPLAGLKKFIGC